MDFTRKLTVRVRGQIYDLKALRALASFEVDAPEAITVPKKESLCNRLCLEEKAGDVAVDLAREVGAILTKKLHIIVEDGKYAGSLSGSTASDQPGSSTQAGESVLDSVYTITFKLMRNSDIIRVVRTLESTAVSEIKLLKSTQTTRVYSVTTNKDLGDLEERIMLILTDQGVDIDRLRFSSFGTEMTIETL